MNDAIRYIQSIFEDVHRIDETNITNLPIYLDDKYRFICFHLLGKDCVLAEPKIMHKIVIDTIKKDSNQIKRLTNRFPVFVFKGLRLSQRKTLVKNKIPFVVPQTQIFIPYPPISLTEVEARERVETEKFKKSTQVVFAYLFLNKVNIINAHRLAQILGYSVTTANRALNELVDKGVLLQCDSGTRKKYIQPQKREYWEQGKQFLFNPVTKSFLLLKNSVNIGDVRLLKSGDTALCEYSNHFDENANYEKHYACYSDYFHELHQHSYPKTIEYSMSSYVCVESLAYNPALLSKDDKIDVVTLYAQFLDKHDERTEIALNEIIEAIING